MKCARSGPGGIRTPDTPVKSRMLCQAELRAQARFSGRANAAMGSATPYPQWHRGSETETFRALCYGEIRNKKHVLDIIIHNSDFAANVYK